MPLDFNGDVVTTDELGAFAVILKENNEYKISSGLPANLGGVAAISFTDILESGASLAERSPVIIPGKRNVRPDGPVCLVLQNNQQMVFFGYNNTTSSIPGLPEGGIIEVPLIYNKLNQIFSPIDNPNPAPAPETRFAIGKNGFTRPFSAFATGTGTYAGTWDFLGEQAIIDGALEICADRGDSEPCTLNNEIVLDEIWSYTKETFLAQIELSNSLAGKRWFPNPSRRHVILKRGVYVLAALRAAIAPLYDTYTCEVVAAGCRTFKINKDKIRVIFSGLYTKMPKGLESLGNDKVKRKKHIERLLKKLPTEVTSCD